MLIEIAGSHDTSVYLLGQELGENADQLIKDDVNASQTGVLQTLNLLLDDDFKGGRSNKERRRRALQTNHTIPSDHSLVDPFAKTRGIEVIGAAATYRRVVENGANVHILDLIKGVQRLDTIGEELMEHKTDTRTARELEGGQIRRVSVDDGPELTAEFGDNVQHNAGLA